MINQVEDLVAKGWYAHLQFIATAADVVCSVVLVVVLDWKGILPIAFLIPAISIVCKCRERQLVKLLQERVKVEMGWLEVMSDSMQNWRLINTFHMNNDICTQFKKTYDKVCSVV